MRSSVHGQLLVYEQFSIHRTQKYETRGVSYVYIVMHTWHSGVTRRVSHSATTRDHRRLTMHASAHIAWHNTVCFLQISCSLRVVDYGTVCVNSVTSKNFAVTNGTLTLGFTAAKRTWQRTVRHSAVLTHSVRRRHAAAHPRVGCAERG